MPESMACATATSSFSTGSGLRLPLSRSARTSNEAPESDDPGLFARGRRTPQTSDRGDVMPPTAKDEKTADTEIDELRKEIDWLDAEIVRLVKRRAEVSQTIGAARMAAGGPRIVVNREMDVLARYRDLGAEGRKIAMALLELGRGKLGR
ncbi:chorismate mutase [Actinophytocola sp.]|uniref:chorismate mutase n=1 Tax=Actinophytocola sp. TaxID=1872138 RepID=UPI002D3F8407|nr:chorismate mutase [Actinophytocola sp.]HYQ69198.1 chorismate mutase [Actinophytocola sp.]